MKILIVFNLLFLKVNSYLMNCVATEAIFYYDQCMACTNSFDNDLTNDGNTTESDIGDIYFSCPTDVYTFSAELIRKASRSLQGRKLNVVTIQRAPFSVVNTESNGEVTYSGVIFEFLKAMNIKHNFTMNIFTPLDGNWGSKVKKGRGKKAIWNGMIGLIDQKKADIGAASFSVTLDRNEVVDFTAAFHQEPTGILIPAPTEGEKFTVLVRPLSKPVWLGVGLTVGVIIPTLYALHVFSLSIHTDKPVKTKSFGHAISDLGFFITGSLVQQGVITQLDKTTRFMVAIWWLITLVVANTYLAILVSFLSAPKLDNLVDSLEDLVKQKKLQWTFRFGTVHHSLFKSEASIGVFKQIGDRVDDDNLIKQDFEGVAKVVTGKYAFIKEKSFLDVALGLDFAEQKKCRLTIARKQFFKVGIALTVQKKSSYLNLFDHEIWISISTGLMEKWKQMHWPRNLFCADAAKYIISTTPRARKLGILDVEGALFLFGCGIFFGFVAFTVEQFKRKKNPKKIKMKLKKDKRHWKRMDCSTRPSQVIYIQPYIK